MSRKKWLALQFFVKKHRERNTWIILPVQSCSCMKLSPVPRARGDTNQSGRGVPRAEDCLKCLPGTLYNFMGSCRDMHILKGQDSWLCPAVARKDALCRVVPSGTFPFAGTCAEKAARPTESIMDLWLSTSCAPGHTGICGAEIRRKQSVDGIWWKSREISWKR